MKFFRHIITIILTFYFSITSYVLSQNKNNHYFPKQTNFKNKSLNLENFKKWFDSISEDEKYSYKIESETIDDLGFKHIKINQYYNLIQIENAVYILHCKNNLIQSVNGYLYNSKPLTTNNEIPLAKAKRKILRRHKNYHITDYISFKYIENSDNKLILCYEFILQNKENSIAEKVYVNKENTKIEKIVKQQHLLSVPTEVETNLSGKRIINTDLTNGIYTLLDSTRGKGIETLSLQNQTNTANFKSIIDSTNSWNLFKNKIDQSALDVHFGATATYDYFLKQHNRNSIDNEGYKLTNLVHYGQNFVNAYWDGKKMIFGDGDSKIGPLVSLDIIAHEITHGLTANTAKLILENEPGALNESFSDIFGVVIDHYTRPEKANWTVAEEVSPFIRSLENPSINNDPDTYEGKNWKVVGGTDFGGIHSNNGVQNHWFYLLTNGGSGVNDFNDTFNVEGIGIEKAAKIAFRNLVYYLTPQSNFKDARLGSISATEDLFGGCSKEVESVTNAWYAVGVGDKYNKIIKSNFDVTYTIGCDSLEVKFINMSQNANKFEWIFGDGSYSNLFEPRHNYNKEGDFNVKLIAYGDTLCGIKDSITKINLIHVFKSDNKQKSITHNYCVFPSIFKPEIYVDTLSTLNWYNKDKLFISDGLTYTFKNIEDSIIYFEPNHYKIGNTNSNLNTAFYNFNIRHLVFDVFQPLIIESVEVNAQSPGNRRFEIRDPNGNVLQSKTINIPSGISRVILNFRVDPGIDYQFGIGGDLIGLSRSNSGVKYPYGIPNLISIKRSNAQNAGYDFYYFFYNWDVKKITCENSIYFAKIIDEKKILDSLKIDNNNKYISINLDTNKFNINWFDCESKVIFSEKNQNTFVPLKKGTYSAIINSIECNNLDTLECIYFSTQSISTNKDLKITIIPNPFNENLVIKSDLENKNDYLIEIKDTAGKTLIKDELSSEKINTVDLESGIYLISIINNENEIISTTKLVKL